MNKSTDGSGANERKETVALCASCDRCRARKTRCDGKRPCENCVIKYMKVHKLTREEIKDVDVELFECVYSPAKRRGPVPGRSGQVRKVNEALEGRPIPSNSASDESNMVLLQQQSIFGAAQPTSQDPFLGDTPSWMDPTAAVSLGGTAALGTQQQIQQQIKYIQQLQAQHHQQYQLATAAKESKTEDQPPSQRQRRVAEEEKVARVPQTVTDHLHLLQRDSREGNRLRAFYRLSVDELFGLPPVPTDEEYCALLNVPGMTPSVLPRSHQAALSAARFAEVALGALVHNEVTFAMELSNATVMLLKECMLEPVKLSYAFEAARAYFLLGCFRAFRGDLPRYFKYRRVAMKNLAQLDVANDSGAELLLAAMSFIDSWAYMMHNADEKRLPSIDGAIPPISCSGVAASQQDAKCGVALDTKSIASDPNNQMWIQGAPPVFLNNNAPLTARALDALACSIRSCCDQANSRFSQINAVADGKPSSGPEPITPTASAVMANEDELCSRNMVLSAFTLLQQAEAGSSVPNKNQGHHLVVSALDAFLENGDDASAGFTDSQIQSLLSVCNTTVENPFLLHHAGPTYHIVTNAAILLCHFLNAMYAVQSTQGQEIERRDMEAAVFEEVYDTFISVRKLLNIHRRKLPVALRCHGIPRPSLHPSAGKPFIDLGETLMCGCHGCQGFVLMACSPCVAAERARSATRDREMQLSMETAQEDEFDKELFELENEFDLDDDQLLNMLSRIVSA